MLTAPKLRSLLCLLAVVGGCSEDTVETPPVGADDSSGSESGDGDLTTGDGDGDGDGDLTTGDGDPTTGDGDGDSTTGDGDGDGDGDSMTGDGDGDGDPTTGDGDGDPTTGDGDGDGGVEFCGDGLINGDEVCDGVEIGGVTCTDLGHDSGELGCNEICMFDESACIDDICGDGMVSGGEDCDSNDLAGESCVTLGRLGGELGCRQDCEFDLSDCSFCGNDLAEDGEVCDGGSGNFPPCTDYGFDGGFVACADTCTDFDPAPLCFDITPAAAVSVGTQHSCALLASGEVKCWGRGTNGRLGQGDTEHRGGAPGTMGADLPPIDLGNVGQVVGVRVGSNLSCALFDTGQLKCWGLNARGELGLGDTDNRGDDPGEMGENLAFIDFGGAAVLDVQGGYLSSCVRLEGGVVKCWGRGERGILGIGSTEDIGDEPGEMGNALQAVDFGPGRSAVQLAVGHEHGCVLLDDDTVKCWGRNISGELGQGDNEDRGDEPNELGAALQPVDFGPGVTPVAVGAYGTTSCAVFDNGKIKCWGDSDAGKVGFQGADGAVGDEPGEMGANLSWALPFLQYTATQVVVGRYHVCMVEDDDSLRCWGRRWEGQLGIGTEGIVVNLDDPPPVDFPPGFVSQFVPSMFSDHGCVVGTDESVRCWGDNDYGQLGLEHEEEWGDGPEEMGMHLTAVPL